MKVITKIYYMLDEEDRKSIKKQMIDLNLTLTQMAENLSVSKAYVSAIINGDKHFTNKIRKQFESQGIVFKGANNDSTKV